MKLKSVSVGIGLSILSFSVSSFPRTIFNSSRVFAEEVSSSCPLPSDIAVTFLNSKCEEVKLKQPQTFYRYYSSSENRYGRYLTTDKYETNVEVIRNLALNQLWGNKATMIQPVTLPAGTTVYQGIVAPQTPTQCYPGGGQQTFIKDTRDPKIEWAEGQNIVQQDFSCP
ncbi:hypothetical protein [Nostoc sp. UHCC 0251]|uniref:hypothetical protein n=1 Tax=Nostoc sp. UHCC 0251 TaxID=3110240 RepID=UPI002B206209|nr:hypothetical protein [Nostoc sp. UHCC 0251]MEA5627044.1 hypothetical protein [Nostoc sp. UHCC 0251]